MLCLGFDFSGREEIVLKTDSKTITLRFFRNKKGGKRIGIDAPPEVEISREKSREVDNGRRRLG